MSEMKATALLTFAALAFAVPSYVMAQTATPSLTPLQTPTNTEQPATAEKPDKDGADDKKDEAEAKKDEPTEEEKNNAELDNALLGAWVYLSPSATNNINNDAATQAITRCLAGANSQSNTSATAPKSAGDLVFFRTTQGIQAFDGKSGSMRFYPTILRKQIGNEIYWGLRNGNVTREIRFKEIGSQLGKMELLLDSDSIYLRCKNVIQATTTQ